MYKLGSQELAEKIPKRFEQWNSSDIQLWFQINQIEIELENIQKQKLCGQNIINMTPNDWVDKFDCTYFIAKRIVEWVQEEVQQFNQIVELLAVRQQQKEQGELRMLRNQSTQTNLNNNNYGEQQYNKNKHTNQNIMIQQKQNTTPVSMDEDYVKFAKSNIQQSSIARYYQKIVKIEVQDVNKIISQYQTIGRSKNNSICLSEESVSRNHAQIKTQKDPFNLASTKYYLIDIGSKFGTYVPIKTTQQIKEGDFYNLDNEEVHILQLSISSKNSKIKTFDLKLQLNRESQFTFNSKNSLILGRKGDIKLPHSDQKAQYRIYYDKEKKGVYIEGIDETIIYKKLLTNKLWDIEQNCDEQGKITTIFGSQKAQIQILKRCSNCLLVNQCQCQC